MHLTKLFDLIIPFTLIIVSSLLLLLGIDGEVKTVLLLAAGWAFRTSISRTKT